MMDGRPLYPQGHHPVRMDSSVDAIDELKPLRRIDVQIKYFYVDFGLSVKFPLGGSSQVVGKLGRDASVPELSWTTPYDAYKANVHALGTVFRKEFQQVSAKILLCIPIYACSSIVRTTEISRHGLLGTTCGLYEATPTRAPASCGRACQHVPTTVQAREPV